MIWQMRLLFASSLAIILATLIVAAGRPMGGARPPITNSKPQGPPLGDRQAGEDPPPGVLVVDRRTINNSRNTNAQAKIRMGGPTGRARRPGLVATRSIPPLASAAAVAKQQTAASIVQADSIPPPLDGVPANIHPLITTDADTSLGSSYEVLPNDWQTLLARRNISDNLVMRANITSATGTGVTAQNDLMNRADDVSAWPTRDQLRAGSCLKVTQDAAQDYVCLNSPNFLNWFCIWKNGEVTVETYDKFSRVQGIIWKRGTTSKKRTKPVYLCLNGGVYAYEEGEATHWSEPIWSQTPWALYIQDDSNVVVYDKTCKVTLWETDSRTQKLLLSQCWPASRERRIQVPTRFGPKRLILNRDKMAQADAAAYCHARGGELMTVDVESARFLFQAFAGVEYNVWVGLDGSNWADGESDWTWLSTGLSTGSSAIKPNPMQYRCGSAWIYSPIIQEATKTYQAPPFVHELEGQPCDWSFGFACQIGCTSVSLPRSDGVVWGEECDGAQDKRTCTAKCSGCYTNGPDGTPTAICEAKPGAGPGTTQYQWSVTGSCIRKSGACTVCSKANLPAVRNAAFYGCNDVPKGGTCIADCSGGFSEGPNGFPSVSCESGVGGTPQWSAVTGSCNRTGTCDPGFYTFGIGFGVLCQFDLVAPVAEGSEVYGECVDHFNGTAVARCEGSYLWYLTGCEQTLTVAGKTALIVANWNFNYPGARAWCRDRGGELMTVETAEASELSTEVLKFSEYVWVGLYARDGKPTTDRNDFLWLSTGRTPIEDKQGTRWFDTEDDFLVSEPDNVGGLEGVCGEWWPDYNRWGDFTCEYRQPFICQLGCKGASLPKAGRDGIWPDDLCDGAQPGAACTASCPEGCKLGAAGVPMVKCSTLLFDSTWSAVEGDCICDKVPNFCPSGGPAPVPNVFWDCPFQTWPGEPCTADCPPGSDGQVTSLCTTTNGISTWQTPIVTCTPIECSGTYETRYAVWNIATPVQLGSRVFAACQAPYTGTAEAVCIGSNLVSVLGGCEKRLTAVSKSLLVVVNFTADYNKARALCQQRGGELINAETLAERQMVAAEMNGIFGWAWVGLYARDGIPTIAKEDYLWLSTGRPPVEDNWQPGQPNNDGGTQGICVEQVTSDLSWRDYDCDYMQPFICQLGCTGVSLPTAPSSSWPGNLCDGAQPGATCTATCLPGCAPSAAGAPRVNCTSSNTWSAVQGSCSCGSGQSSTVSVTGCSEANLPVVDGSVWPGSTCDGAQAGMTCVATCNEGYTPGPAGPPTVSCTASISWSAQQGSCVPTAHGAAVSCSNNPRNVNYAKWACGGTPAGSTCTATCAPGTIGTVTAKCLSTGSWEAPKGLCRVVVCSGSPASTGATFTCPTTTQPLKNCTGKCSTGYLGNISATCRPVGTSTTGAWAINGACARQCTGNPTQPANGVFNCVGIVAGQTCYATCKQGYIGAPSSVCQASGLWSQVDTPCAPGCAGSTASGQAFNGMFSCGAITSHGGSCFGRCLEGFVGNLTAICQTDGTWATKGRCVPSNIVCEDNPSTPTYGIFSCGTSRVGRVCTADCNGGTQSLPRPTSVCTPAGTWSDVAGECTCSGVAEESSPGVFYCGVGLFNQNKCCPVGYCCSALGICGQDEFSCGQGCQKNAGQCSSTSTEVSKGGGGRGGTGTNQAREGPEGRTRPQIKARSSP